MSGEQFQPVVVKIPKLFRAARRRSARKEFQLLRRTSEELLARLDLPDGSDIATLIDRLSVERGRPIKMVSLTLGAGRPCGLWLATEALDLIVVEACTGPLHRDHIIAHELAHMLCCHSRSPGLDPDSLGLLLPSLDPRRVLDVLGRTSYPTQEEQAAEIVASLILERVTRPPKEPRWPVPSGDAEAVARIDQSLKPLH
ncbi:toxin [Streptomyces violascens]|uniref:toxin n=1 Tax=Streptomyces violascens TaxID=67381 RepID=UPI003697F709